MSMQNSNIKDFEFYSYAFFMDFYFMLRKCSASALTGSGFFLKVCIFCS